MCVVGVATQLFRLTCICECDIHLWLANVIVCKAFVAAAEAAKAEVEAEKAKVQDREHQIEKLLEDTIHDTQYMRDTLSS